MWHFQYKTENAYQKSKCVAQSSQKWTKLNAHITHTHNFGQPYTAKRWSPIYNTSIYSIIITVTNECVQLLNIHLYIYRPRYGITIIIIKHMRIIIRCGVNSIPELMGNSISGAFLLNELKLINLESELKFAPKKFNTQINLPFNILIQKYFFHDNPTLNIN